MKIAAWIALLWAIFVTLVYLILEPSIDFSVIIGLMPEPLTPTLEALLHHARSLAIWIGAFLGSLTLGCRVIMRLKVGAGLSRLCLGSAVGLTLTANAIFLLGVFGLYRPMFFWSLLIFLLLLFVIDWPVRLEPLFGDAASEIRTIVSAAPLWLSGTVGLAMLIAFIMAFVPETSYDSWLYHLGVPRWYLHEGGINDMTLMHAKFPPLMSLLYTWGLGLSGETAAKLFHWVFGVLLALCAMAWGKEEGEPQGGLMGAAAFLLMPMSMFNWWTAGADIALSALTLIACWCWVSHFQQGNRHRLILAGFFAGAACATKYTGVLTAAVLIIMHSIHVVAQNRRWKQAISDAMVLGSIVLLVSLPWLLKNWVHAGNPVYPFLGSWLGGEGYEAQRVARFWAENKGWTPRNLLEILVLPWHLTFNNSAGLSFLGPMPLALIPGALFVIFTGRLSKSMRWTASTALTGLVVMLLFNRLTRYSLPFLAPLLLTAGCAWSALWRTKNRAFQTILSAGLMAMITINIIIGAGVIRKNYQPWRVLSGHESRQDYQSYSRPGLLPFPATAMYAFAKTVMPQDGRLLILGDEKTSTCFVPYRVAGAFDIPLPVRWSDSSGDGEVLYRRVSQEGVTHILVNMAEAKRLAGYGIFDWPGYARAAFDEFWNAHVRLIKATPIPENFFSGHALLLLYEVLNQKEAASKPVPQNPLLKFFRNNER
ncbi:MAG: glycosyltransferase family 39 protein [Elusimicrobia bacterium]|nr:glycosyltransferase family 39 protein [Elusimicrobiota bacterium]